jgi:hypothetical protein
MLSLPLAGTGKIFAAAPSNSLSVEITCTAIWTNHYEITATSPQTAGIGWPEIVTAIDQFGNPLVLDSQTVINLSSTGNVAFYADAGYTSQITSIKLTNGQATIYLRDTTAETVRISVWDGNGKTGLSDPILVNPGPIFAYEISATSPQIAGFGWTETLTARDAFGNIVTTDSTTNVALSASGSAAFYTNGTYATTTSVVTLNAGQAVLYVRDTKMETIVLSALDGLGRTGSSAPIQVLAATAYKLAFRTQPAGGLEREPLATQPTVEILDLYDNFVAVANNHLVQMSFANNPGNAELTGTTAISSVNGLSAFTDLIVTQSGQGYVLLAQSLGLVAATSAPFDVAEVNRSPQVISGPSATPNPAKVLEEVRFDCLAEDDDGDALTYTWNFGDGSVGFGPSPTHVYATTGTYLVEVTISDGQISVTGSLVVEVVSDGEGAKPNGEPLAIQMLRLAVDFKKADRDRFQIRAWMKLPSDFKPSGGNNVEVNIGGNKRKYVLDQDGRTKGGLLGGVWVRWNRRQSKWVGPGGTEFWVRLNREELKAHLEDEGILNETVKNKPVKIWMALTLDDVIYVNGALRNTQRVYIGEANCLYTAKENATGRAMNNK